MGGASLPVFVVVVVHSLVLFCSPFGVCVCARARVLVGSAGGARLSDPAVHDVKRRKTNWSEVLATSTDGLQDLADEEKRSRRAAKFGT